MNDISRFALLINESDRLYSEAINFKKEDKNKNEKKQKKNNNSSKEYYGRKKEEGARVKTFTDQDDLQGFKKIKAKIEEIYKTPESELMNGTSAIDKVLKVVRDCLVFGSLASVTSGLSLLAWFIHRYTKKKITLKQKRYLIHKLQTVS